MLQPQTRALSHSSVLSRRQNIFIIGKTDRAKDLKPNTTDDSDEVSDNITALTHAQKAVSDFKLYPDEETFDTLYNGVKYKDLPYVYIRCTANNTRLAAYMADNTPIHYTTPVLNGFLHAKKRTNVAAQATGLAMGQKLRNLNQRTIRVRVDGFNAGRISAITGLIQAGLTVVSVSDVTYIDWVWVRRAKKRKRV